MDTVQNPINSECYTPIQLMHFILNFSVLMFTSILTALARV